MSSNEESLRDLCCRALNFERIILNYQVKGLSNITAQPLIALKDVLLDIERWATTHKFNDQKLLNNSLTRLATCDTWNGDIIEFNKRLATCTDELTLAQGTDANISWHFAEELRSALMPVLEDTIRRVLQEDRSLPISIPGPLMEIIINQFSGVVNVLRDACKGELGQKQESLLQAQRNLDRAQQQLNCARNTLEQRDEELRWTSEALRQTELRLVEIEVELDGTNQSLDKINGELCQAKQKLCETEEELGQTLQILIQTKKNWLDSVKQLRAKQVDLLSIARNGDVESLLEVERSGAMAYIDGIQVNYSCESHAFHTKQDMTVLFIACEYGHSAAVELFLMIPYIVVNFRDKKLRTPLMAACRNGHTAVVQVLLLHDEVNVNAKDEVTCSETCVFVCVNCLSYADHVGCVQDGRTAFYYASKHGHLDVVKALLVSGGVVLTKKDRKVPSFVLYLQ